MAAVFTKTNSTVLDTQSGGRRLGFETDHGTLDLGTYATGGVAFDEAIIGSHVGDIVSVQLQPNSARDVCPHFDVANGKIKAFVSPAGAEVGNGVDLSLAGKQFYIKVDYTR